MSDPWYIPLYNEGDNEGLECENYGCFIGSNLGSGYPISRFNLIKKINKLNYTILYDEGDLLIFGLSDRISVVAFRKIQPPTMNKNELDIVKKVMLKLKIKSMP